eukprot:6382862-Amphidinium_carterae.2
MSICPWSIVESLATEDCKDVLGNGVSVDVGIVVTTSRSSVLSTGSMLTSLWALILAFRASC